MSQGEVVLVADEMFRNMKLAETRRGVRVGYKTRRHVRLDAQGGSNSGEALTSRKFSHTPSGLIGSKPQIYYELPVEVGNVDDITQLVGQIGLKPLGGNKMIKTGTLTLNTLTIATNEVTEKCDMLSVTESRKVLSEISPAFVPDNATKFNLQDADKNVLASGDQAGNDENYSSRGLFGNGYRITDVVEDKTNRKVQFTLHLKEALCLEGLSFRNLDPHPFYNLSKFKIDLTFNANPWRNLFNIAEGSDFTVKWQTGANLNVYCLIDEFELSDLIKLPTEPLVYNMPKVEYEEKFYSKTVTGNGTSVTIQSDLYESAVVPSYCCMAIVDGSYDQTDDDAKMAVPHRTMDIDNVTVEINTQDNKLSSVLQVETLYEMSRKAGYNLSFANFTSQVMSWKSGAGAGDASTKDHVASNGWFCFKLSDLGISVDKLSANVAEKITMKFNIKAKNNTDVSMDSYKFKFFYVTDSMIVADGMNYLNETASVLPSELMDVSNESGDVRSWKIVYEADHSENVLGGNKFINGLRNLGRKIGRALRSDTAKQISKVLRNAPFAKKFVGDDSAIGKFAKDQGYGNTGGEVLRVGRGKGKGKGKGGAMMSRAELLGSLE